MPSASEGRSKLFEKLARRVMEALVLANLVVIIALFKAKVALDRITKLVNLLLSGVLSIMLLLSCVFLGLLYDLTGYSNSEEHHVKYNELDTLFWLDTPDKHVKLSNDFQSLIYGTKYQFDRYNQSVLDEVVCEKEFSPENITFTAAPVSRQDANSSHFKKPHLGRLKWWKPATIENTQNSLQIPELVEDGEETDGGESTTDDLPQTLRNDEVVNNLKGKHETPVIYPTGNPVNSVIEPSRRHSLFFKGSNLKFAFSHNSPESALLYSKHLGHFKTSRSLLKFGPEHESIDVISHDFDGIAHAPEENTDQS